MKFGERKDEGDRKRRSKVKTQEVVKIETCHPYHLEAEIEDRDEKMEKVGALLLKQHRSVEAHEEHDPVYEERSTCSHTVE